MKNEKIGAKEKEGDDVEKEELSAKKKGDDVEK